MTFQTIAPRRTTRASAAASVMAMQRDIAEPVAEPACGARKESRRRRRSPDAQP